MTDFLLLEQLQRMVMDTTKPRLIFRKGISAGGFFRPYVPMSEYTRASVFGSPDEITPVLVRFSSMLGDEGTADTVRNIKGMNVKFQTKEKAYDMMCSSLPVMFISHQDRLMELIDVFSRYKSFDGIAPRKFWEFVIRNPESVNCALRFFSRQGIRDSYIDMNWYSVNDSVWSNSEYEEFLVRYRWVPILDDNERIRKLDRYEAEFLAGYEPDRAANDLKRHISHGNFPSYELQIQMEYDADDEQNQELHKRTLLWDEKETPYFSIGMMRLTAIPENHRRECDLLSFAPSNTIDGIDLYRDDLTCMIDYFYKCEAWERGVIL